MLKTLAKKTQPSSDYWLVLISLGANNWDESVVEETLCILCAKGIINVNYKILATNDTNTLPE